MDNVYTVVVPVGVVVVAVVDEAVAGGVIEDDVEPAVGDAGRVAVARKNEVRVGLSDYIQKQAANSVPLPGSVLAVMFSRPDSGDSEQGPVGEVEGRVHCSHFAEDKSAEKASEGVDKYSDVHTSYTSGD